jgi:hypothetical protein
VWRFAGAGRDPDARKALLWRSGLPGGLLRRCPTVEQPGSHYPIRRAGSGPGASGPGASRRSAISGHGVALANVDVPWDVPSAAPSTFPARSPTSRLPNRLLTHQARWLPGLIERPKPAMTTQAVNEPKDLFCVPPPTPGFEVQHTSLHHRYVPPTWLTARLTRFAFRGCDDEYSQAGGVGV